MTDVAKYRPDRPERTLQRRQHRVVLLGVNGPRGEGSEEDMYRIAEALCHQRRVLVGQATADLSEKEVKRNPDAVRRYGCDDGDLVLLKKGDGEPLISQEELERVLGENDLIFDPNVESRYGESSKARLKALREKLSKVITSRK